MFAPHRYSYLASLLEINSHIAIYMELGSDILKIVHAVVYLDIHSALFGCIAIYPIV